MKLTKAGQKPSPPAARFFSISGAWRRMSQHRQRGGHQRSASLLRHALCLHYLGVPRPLSQVRVHHPSPASHGDAFERLDRGGLRHSFSAAPRRVRQPARAHPSGEDAGAHPHRRPPRAGLDAVPIERLRGPMAAALGRSLGLQRLSDEGLPPAAGRAMPCQC